MSVRPPTKSPIRAFHHVMLPLAFLLLPLLTTSFIHPTPLSPFSTSQKIRIPQIAQCREKQSQTKPTTSAIRSTHQEASEETPVDDNKGDIPPNDLLKLLQPAVACDVDQTGATSLAYIGDVVFELFIRSRYVWPSRRTTDLQNKVVGIVRAETQADLLDRIQNSDFQFTKKEYSILQRGRNSGGSGKRTRGPKRFFSADGTERGGATIYQDATALEALLGYLYIKDPPRCFAVLDWFRNELDEMDKLG